MFSPPLFLHTHQELIREKPKDVIQWIEEEGVIKLGEFDVQVWPGLFIQLSPFPLSSADE